MSKMLMIPVLMAVIAGGSLFASESFAAQGHDVFDKGAISCPGSSDMASGLEAGWRGHGDHHGDGHGC
ncbi:hypothetical protein [uncultured Desulfovibrio sp.]|uniref:hypothetical protein n=1 Tax=uncultured Desulfovibrio sp. TaxID=167968 RepID=UPI0026080844|nr:hypothetical protein [uncultured Desulfovibrio sp.]